MAGKKSSPLWDDFTHLSSAILCLICYYYYIVVFYQMQKKQGSRFFICHVHIQCKTWLQQKHIGIIYRPLAALLSKYRHRPLKNPYRLTTSRERSTMTPESDRFLLCVYSNGPVATGLSPDIISGNVALTDFGFTFFFTPNVFLRIVDSRA